MRLSNQLLTNFPVLMSQSSQTLLHYIKLFNNSASKHCILDPVPAKIVKECIEILLPVITNIINLCMEHGEFPEWRCAVVDPILKKRGLPLDFPNYRPVMSNLPYTFQNWWRVQLRNNFNNICLRTIYHPLITLRIVNTIVLKLHYLEYILIFWIIWM